jgi:rRNA-processing protein FCF1
MSPACELSAWIRCRGLLVDTNLLVLFVVGSVNRSRIPRFKRTCQYTPEDYDLLLRAMAPFADRCYTVAHVMAEVSNLTDLPGAERAMARLCLQKALTVLAEPPVASIQAAGEDVFPRLGLSDAAILVVAREQGCAVLTDDLDLYRALAERQVPVLNFTHVRAAAWDL